MLFIKGICKNSYSQKTRKDNLYLVHEFEEQASDGRTIIQRVKDFRSGELDHDKVIELPVFVVAYPNKAGDSAGFDLVRVYPPDGKAKGVPKL